MEVFWACGYAGATTVELLKAMGIAPQSLYGTFGDKQALFHKALWLYADKQGLRQRAQLRSSSSPRVALRAWLLGSITSSGSETGLGCMLVNATGEVGPSDLVVLEIAAAARAALCEAVTGCLTQGQEQGEIDPHLDLDLAARWLVAGLQGLQVAARCGELNAELVRVAGGMLRCLLARRG